MVNFLFGCEHLFASGSKRQHAHCNGYANGNNCKHDAVGDAVHNAPLDKREQSKDNKHAHCHTKDNCLSETSGVVTLPNGDVFALVALFAV